MNIRDMQESKRKLVHDARALLDLADAEKRELTAAEDARYTEMMTEVDGLTTKIDRAIALEREEASLAAKADERTAPAPEANAAQKAELKTRAFDRFIRSGIHAMSAEEVRALQMDSDEAGGYLGAPEQFVQNLIKAVDDMTYLLQWGTIHTLTSAASLGIPSLDADPADADWTSELGTGDEDSTMGFGKRKLEPKPLAKRIKVSNEMLRRIAGADTLVSDRLAYKFQVSVEKAGMTGTGSGQPLGIFTASSNGISTSRDVSTDNAQTALKVDNLKSVKGTLKQQYLENAKWVMHRDVVTAISKLKDGSGRYLWQDAIRAGEPDMLLSIPVFASEYAPNTFTSGLYMACLGDFRFYHWARSLDFQIQRLVELYAATNQTGFIGRIQLDGQPVLEEAFVRSQLA